MLIFGERHLHQVLRVRRPLQHPRPHRALQLGRRAQHLRFPRQRMAGSGDSILGGLDE